MRVVNFSDGKLELNFMWLPTFISQNFYIMKELEKEWAEKFKGVHATTDTLDQIHAWTVEWLQNKFQIKGLNRYLNAIEWVDDQ